MTHEEVTAIIIDELGRIAPEIELTQLDPDAELREACDIDSMDFLNLVTALSERLKIEIPETDYASLATLRRAAAYLVQKLDAAA
jgi:acyl carrier protein